MGFREKKSIYPKPITQNPEPNKALYIVKFMGR